MAAGLKFNQYSTKLCHLHVVYMWVVAQSISVFSTFPILFLLLDASIYVLHKCALLMDSVLSTSESKHLNLSLTGEEHVQIFFFF